MSPEPGYGEDGNPLVQGVVSATMAVSGSGTLGTRTPLAKQIETAMAKAIEDANAEGINDPVIVRERMMEARDRVKAEAKRVEVITLRVINEMSALGPVDLAKVEEVVKQEMLMFGVDEKQEMRSVE